MKKIGKVMFNLSDFVVLTKKKNVEVKLKGKKKSGTLRVWLFVVLILVADYDEGCACWV